MKRIEELKSTFIIAEAGINHNGSIILAKELIDAASQSGADAVKFQNFKARRVISRYAKKPEYQKKNSPCKATMLDMLEALELDDKDYYELYKYAIKKNIIFLSTPKDIISAKLLQKIGVSIYKVGSSEINNFEFLDFVASLQKPILLSTGMSTMGEIEAAVNAIKKRNNSLLILLHCISQYPCPFEQANLRAMPALQDTFHLPVGYSDHTLGIEISLAAVALGARVIEKHFTLDKKMVGPDHAISIEPAEFRNLVVQARHIEIGMGDGIKRPSPCEFKNRDLLRRSLVFKRGLKNGSRLTAKDIIVKRPGCGIEPKFKPILMGKVLKRDVLEDQPLKWEMF